MPVHEEKSPDTCRGFGWATDVLSSLDDLLALQVARGEDLGVRLV